MYELEYLPYHQLGERANIIVDGEPTPSTSLLLSHWPRSTCPNGLADDLSAQMVFRYLDHLRAGKRPLHGDAQVVSNNHFDQDGLVSVFSLVDPEQALRCRERLVDLAEAGDFGTFSDRQSARLAMALGAFAERERSPLGTEAFDGSYSELCAALYRELLPRFPGFLDETEAYRALWEEEDAALNALQVALARGQVRITEEAPLDLAVVEDRVGVLQSLSAALGGRFQRVRGMAIYNATQRTCIAFVEEHRYEVVYRYETWVKYVSRPIRARRDLAGLAAQLCERERDARWAFDEVSKITPRLYLSPGSHSALSSEVFVGTLKRFLEETPAAWDPA